MLRGMDPVPAFVLHQREWRDAGRIFELLTPTHGRISVFAQGVRGPRSRLGALLQPFIALRVTWAGRGEAPRLTGAEREPGDSDRPPVTPSRLMSGWYLSELVMRLTLRHDPQPELFAHYAEAVGALRAGDPVERALRLFEKRLLDVLGYGIPAEVPPLERDPLGLSRLAPGCLGRLVSERLDSPEDLEQVRPVLRRALDLCLEGADLRTRTVARAMVEMEKTGR
jgi:DNA repair protein RecO (recombination protein O)